MINAQDIKIGTAIRMDGKLYFCIDFLHVKPGKGNTFMRTKLKDIVDGYVLERRFNIDEDILRYLVIKLDFEAVAKAAAPVAETEAEVAAEEPVATEE